MDRYARQQVLPQVGASGQQRLRGAHVVVVGAGALGCAALQYLVGAGIGRNTIIDPDVVDRSNLHRQTLYGESSVGRQKVFAAQRVLQDLNPSVEILACAQRLDPSTAELVVTSADVVLDCADSFAVTYVLSDVCQALRKPFISASVLALSGYAGGFCGTAPSLRAVFPELPANTANCTTAGVLGPVAGMLGCLQAQMALAVLLDLTPSPLGQIVVMDLQSYGFRSFRFDGAAEPAEAVAHFIAVSTLSKQDLIIDLRSLEETPAAVHPNAIRGTLQAFKDGQVLPQPGQRVVLCCRSGVRAWRAAEALRRYWQGPIALVAAGDTAPSA